MQHASPARSLSTKKVWWQSARREMSNGTEAPTMSPIKSHSALCEETATAVQRNPLHQHPALFTHASAALQLHGFMRSYRLLTLNACALDCSLTCCVFGVRWRVGICGQKKNTIA